MSGLDAIASVAGLVSLGIQLGESALKLKRLFHAVKDAPRIVSRIVFALETMAMALQQLERQTQQNPRHVQSPLLDRCARECRGWTLEIRQLVNQMESRMIRSPRLGGRVYIAFKERDSQQLLAELEKAKSSLELSYMMYLAEEQKRRDQAYLDTLAAHGNLLQSIETQFRTGTTTILKQLQDTQPRMVVSTTDLMASTSTRLITASTEEICLQIDHQRSSVPTRYKKRNGQTKLRVTFRLPDWLCRRIWDFAVVDTQCTRSMLIRTYNIVPQDSPVIRHCINGDLTNLRMLIESGKATPLDVCETKYVFMDKKHNMGPWKTLLEV